MNDQRADRASGKRKGRTYLIREMNCHLEITGHESIWISNRSPDLSHYEKDSAKLIGPLPTVDADTYVRQPRTVLETAGLEVLDEAVAED